MCNYLSGSPFWHALSVMYSSTCEHVDGKMIKSQREKRPVLILNQRGLLNGIIHNSFADHANRSV